MAELVLRLHEGQRRVWNSPARFIAMLAGTQGGKTVFGVHWMHREIQTRGPGDYLVVTATFPLLNLKLLPEFLEVFRGILNLGDFNESQKIFTLSKAGDVVMWGSEQEVRTRIIFASATNPEAIESATAKGAWLDEAGQKQFRRESWEAIQRRLSINQGRVLFTTTIYNLGWLKTEVYDRWKDGDPEYEVIQFDSTVNPSFPRDEYERARKVLPAWKFDMFYRGLYTKPAGLIYDSFDERVCVIPRNSVNIGADWPRYVGHDFGPVHTAAMWYAQDPGTGYLYAYREYQTSSKMNIGRNVEEFKRLSQGENIRKRAGGAHSEDGWREAYILNGWPIVEPSVNDVEVGIDRVYAWHKTNKLFVFNDLLLYLDQKLSYSRELDDNYEPTEKIDNKAAYHLMDAERYILSDLHSADIVHNLAPRKIRVVTR